MYTKTQFGKELKKCVYEEVDTIEIGKWAHSVYYNLPSSEDANFLKLLLHLGAMEWGSEFAFSDKELDKIADDLIAGKDIVLSFLLPHKTMV